MRYILILTAAALLACRHTRGPAQPAIVKENTFSQGKIQVETLNHEERRQAEIVIALLPFKNNSLDKRLDPAGVALSDLILARISPRPGFKVVERQRIEDIMNELKLGPLGAVDQATAVKIGGLLGANVLGFGSVSRFGDDVTLSMRLVQVETGEIVGGVTEKGEDPSKLDILAEKVAERISAALTSGLKPGR